MDSKQSLANDRLAKDILENKTKLLHLYFRIELFRKGIELIFSSKDEFKDWYKRELGKDVGRVHVGKCIVFDEGDYYRYIVFVDKESEGRDKIEIISILAHELSHIAKYMCEDMGIQSGEVEAYILQSSMRYFLSKLPWKCFSGGPNV